MKRTLPLVAGGVILALSYLGILSADDQKKDETPKKTLVAQKLDHAQKLLAAVATNDNSEIAKHAEGLIRNSKDLAWVKVRNERYEELGKEYRTELTNLIKAAQFKNSQALALGYVKVSLACFNCHDHVREIKIAQP